MANKARNSASHAVKKSEARDSKRRRAEQVRKDRKEGARDRTADPITNTVETHEEAMFREAASFLLVRREGPKRWDRPYSNFVFALADARALKNAGYQMLLYAITTQGGATLLPAERWDVFEKIWNDRSSGVDNPNA